MIGKACRYPRCTNIHNNEGSRCDEHKRDIVWTKHKAKNPFYDSKRWRKTRAHKLSLNRLCEACNQVIATEVHHILKLEDHLELAHELSNLQSLCKSCHASETARESNIKRKKDYEKLF